MKGHRLEKYLITKLPVVSESATIKDALLLFEDEVNTYDSLDYIYCIDKNQKLLGVFTVRQLFNNKKSIKIATLLQTKIISVSPHEKLEVVANIALRNNLKQIPVVKNGVLVGAVPSRKIFSALNKTLEEQIFNQAGIEEAHLNYKNTLEIPILYAVLTRVPWLLIGLIGAVAIAAIVHSFEEMLSGYMLVAAFIPTIVYACDALANQTLTILVRDFAVLGKKMSILKYYIKQTTTALCLGIIIGSFMFMLISLVWQVPYVAFVISLATFISIIITTNIAMCLAILIKRFHVDPALGSGPIATIFTDMTSVLVYLLVVMYML
ncbi:MAG: magnesium transporter [Candidatus Woesearchaeota archaeon]